MPTTSPDPRIGRAPGRLATVQAFVNTRDIEQATDKLVSPAALDRWFAASDLGLTPARPAPGCRAAPADEADLALVKDLRETLRAVLRSHARRPGEGDGASWPAGPAADLASPPAVARLAEIAASLQTAMTADADGSLRVVAGTAGSRGALATLLLIAAEACTLGTWTRLKVCSADDCEWAFYDRSPTRNGCWCSMQICGSRAKSRAYRRRATGRAGPVAT